MKSDCGAREEGRGRSPKEVVKIMKLIGDRSAILILKSIAVSPINVSKGLFIKN